MKEVSRKRFYKHLKPGEAIEVYCNRNVSILFYKGIVYKSTQMGHWKCEISLDLKTVEDGEEDTKFYMSIE